MSEHQFEAIIAAIQSLKSDMDARFNNVEGRLDKIEGELRRIEHWTPFNANQDSVAKLAALKS